MTLNRRVLAPALALAAALALGACAESPSAAGQSPSPPADRDLVVAEVEGRKITLKDVDDKWAELDAAERNRVTQLLYESRRTMLNQLVGDALIEQAAKAAGQSMEAYADQELARRTSPVSEAEIQQFYEQNKDRTQGRTLDQLRGPVKEFLEGQRRMQARTMLVDDLRAKAASVRVMLDPPRYTVSLADHDPARGDAASPVTLVEFSDYQ